MKSVGLKKINGLYGNYANLWDLKNQRSIWKLCKSVGLKKNQRSIWELCKSVGLYVLSDGNTEICGKKSEKGDR